MSRSNFTAVNSPPEVAKASTSYREGFVAKLKRQPLKTGARVIRRRLAEIRSPWKAVPDDSPECYSVPSSLRPPSYSYAGRRGGWFEEYYFENWKSRGQGGPLYLPIFWDHFFLQSQTGAYLPGEFKHRYHQIHRILDEIREEPENYYTILGMYDFPIWDWHRFPENICVFSCAGTGDITLPLLHGERRFSAGPKSHHVSFMGKLDGFSDISGVRSKMRRVLGDVAYFGHGAHWEEVMRGSTYSLAPRGLGPSCFRLYEAISLGSIPIYIWNEKMALPFAEEVDWNELAVIRHEDELEDLRDWLLSGESKRWAQGREDLLRDYHQRYSNYAAVADYVGRTTEKMARQVEFSRRICR